MCIDIDINIAIAILTPKTLIIILYIKLKKKVVVGVTETRLAGLKPATGAAGADAGTWLPTGLLFLRGQSKGCKVKYDEDVIAAACQRSS